MDEEYFEASIDPDIELQLKGEIVANINANAKKKELIKKTVVLDSFQMIVRVVNAWIDT